MKGFTLPQVIALIFLILIGSLIIVFIINLLPEKKPNYVVYEKSDKPEIILNGGYVVYTEMNKEYEELGAKAFTKDGKNISNKLETFIYEENRLRSEIDTSKFTTYRVFYSVSYKGKITSVSRVVKIIDTEGPKITLPTTQTISVNEVSNYDLQSGVKVTDNSGEYDLKYDNTLKEKVGDYIITYTATDKSGNKTVRKRLIKVV